MAFEFHAERMPMNSIRIALIVLATCAGCAGMRPGEWTALIDGEKGLDNFYMTGDANWRGEDGAIQADRKTAKENSYLVSKYAYRDFQILAEFWASDDANSGIFMRCADVNNIGDRTCYEANIFDRRPDPTYGTGAIVNFAPIKDMPKAGGKWNTYDITVQGSKVSVVLNGQKTVELEDKTLTSGPIALQYAAGAIKFRKVQVRTLPPA
jgi:Domain of Unknown Function (DUF1080)